MTEYEAREYLSATLIDPGVMEVCRDVDGPIRYRVVIEFPNGQLGYFAEPQETEAAAWIAAAQSIVNHTQPGMRPLGESENDIGNDVHPSDNGA